MAKLTIIGAGSWGSALSRILADNGHDVLLYDNNLDIIKEINENHTNLSKLPMGKLPDKVKATGDLKEALKASSIIVLSVPTKVLRSVLNEITKILDEPKLFVNTSKGLEPITYKRVSEVVYEVIKYEYIKGFVALTGPSHGEEVIKQLMTVVCSVSKCKEDAMLVQKLFSNQTYFRVYTNDDLIGAELCSSIKNVFAIASGMLYGIGYGDNARAALITRALVEMRKIVIKKGGKYETLYGLTGVGDLIVTTTSLHSRNFQAGIKLAQGKNLKETIDSMSMVVEGARTALAAYEMSRDLKLDTPIIDAIYHIIYEQKDVKTTINELMARDLKEE